MSSKPFLWQIGDVFSNFSRHSPTFSWFSPNFLRISWIFPRICRTDIKFRRTFSKSRGKKNKLRGKENKLRGKKFGKYRTKSRRIPIFSSQKCVSEKKRPIFPEKHSIICDFQTRWESHISHQLFLSSKSRVKWKGGNCVFFLNPR